tara:strand:- start:1045 stop:1284 length:240 start_codon:yes stop_codon:yes gene_type:complete
VQDNVAADVLTSSVFFFLRKMDPFAGTSNVAIVAAPLVFSVTVPKVAALFDMNTRELSEMFESARFGVSLVESGTMVFI